MLKWVRRLGVTGLCVVLLVGLTGCDVVAGSDQSTPNANVLLGPPVTVGCDGTVQVTTMTAVNKLPASVNVVVSGQPPRPQPLVVLGTQKVAGSTMANNVVAPGVAPIVLRQQPFGAVKIVAGYALLGPDGKVNPVVWLVALSRCRLPISVPVHDVAVWGWV
jgi:hypothetical protein